jgi:signal peptidase II
MFKRLAFIILSTSLFVGCDQTIKGVAKSKLVMGERTSFLGDTFRLSLTENHGAFLGLGSGLPESSRFIIFTALIAAGLFAGLAWLTFSRKLSRLTIVASILVISGGAGNLIDRIFNNGGVIDFLNMGLGSIRTGIFNVADIYITAGALLIVLSSVFQSRKDA